MGALVGVFKLRTPRLRPRKHGVIVAALVVGPT